MSDKVDTGGKRLNLFPAKKQKKKLSVDDKAFNTMEAVADKTNVDIFAEGKKSSTKGIHTALLAAGMTTAYDNVADVADATLYALEGEFGEAAWSMAAAIPIVGQMVSGRRAVKAAKEAGEEMVTLYRGNQGWHRKSMVREGKFVGPDVVSGHHAWIPHTSAKANALFVIDDPVYAMGRTRAFTWKFLDEKQLKVSMKTGSYWDDDMVGWVNKSWGKHWNKKKHLKYTNELKSNIKRHDRLWGKNIKERVRKDPSNLQHVLEFEVPKSWVNKHGKSMLPGAYQGTIRFDEGLPVGFLKKIHLGY